MPAGWYPDPLDARRLRWWDGQWWSDHVSTAGQVQISPMGGAPPIGQVAPWAPPGVGASTTTGGAGPTGVPSAPPPPMVMPPQGYPYVPAPVGDERLPPGIHLANPWARLGAYLLDVVLIIVTLVVGWLVWTLVVWSKGQTPGQQICGQRVVMKDTGEAAGWGRMCLRDLVIRGLAIGLLSEVTLGIFGLVAALMIFSTYHETMWDKWAGTLVVDDRDGRTLGR